MSNGIDDVELDVRRNLPALAAACLDDSDNDVNMTSRPWSDRKPAPDGQVREFCGPLEPWRTLASTMRASPASTCRPHSSCCGARELCTRRPVRRTCILSQSPQSGPARPICLSLAETKFAQLREPLRRKGTSSQTAYKQRKARSDSSRSCRGIILCTSYSQTNDYVILWLRQHHA